MERKYKVEKQPYNNTVKALVHAVKKSDLGKFHALLQEIPDINIFCKKRISDRKFSVLEDVSRRLCDTDESKYCEFVQLLLEHGATWNMATVDSIILVSMFFVLTGNVVK